SLRSGELSGDFGRDEDVAFEETGRAAFRVDQLDVVAGLPPGPLRDGFAGEVQLDRGRSDREVVVQLVNGLLVVERPPDLPARRPARHHERRARVIHHRDRQVVVGALLDAQVEAPRGHDCFCLSNSATRSLSSWFCACNLRMITRYCAFSHSALLSGSRSISTAISLTSSCWAVSSCSTSVLRWGRGVDVAA